MNRIVRQLRYRLFMVKEFVLTTLACWDDCRRYVRYSCTSFSRRDMVLGQLQGRLIAACHVLEKGLSMPDCRPRFGASMVRTLYDLLREYESKGGGCEDPHFRSSLEVLEGYSARHQEMGISVDDIITSEISQAMERWHEVCRAQTCGVVSHTRDTFFGKTSAAYPEFSASRHSCRNFDPALTVARTDIEQAVRTSLRTPSACNRQPWRVYAITDKAMVACCMKLHSGSRGFQHLVPALLIIAARIDVYTGPGERYQTYVDGGLFSMSLMLGLHHQRLGCVPLNWSVTPDLDRQLKAVAGIPDFENILMLLAVGHPAAEFSVPQSARRNVGEVLAFPSTDSPSQT